MSYIWQREVKKRETSETWRQRTQREGQVWWGNKSLMVEEAEYEITLDIPRGSLK